MSVAQVMMVALIGGALLSFMNVWLDYKKPPAQRASKDKLWYFFLFAWPVVGAILAWVFSLETNMKPVLTFTIGLTAPTTIEAIMSKAPALVPGVPAHSEE